jgi:hypothetical protein
MTDQQSDLAPPFSLAQRSCSARSEWRQAVMRLATIAMKGIVADKTAGERLLERSDIDWTIVYATRLTAEPRSGGYRTVEGTLTGVGTIGRADVADALLSMLSDETSVRQSRVVTSR